MASSGSQGKQAVQQMWRTTGDEVAGDHDDEEYTFASVAEFYAERLQSGVAAIEMLFAFRIAAARQSGPRELCATLREEQRCATHALRAERLAEKDAALAALRQRRVRRRRDHLNEAKRPDALHPAPERRLTLGTQ